jgi:hypothetical protein
MPVLCGKWRLWHLRAKAAALLSALASKLAIDAVRSAQILLRWSVPFCGERLSLISHSISVSLNESSTYDFCGRMDHMSDGLFQDIAEYIRLSKDGLDLMRGAWSLLPKGEKRDEAEHKLRAAEEALKRSDAALAQKLGYQLCQCTFPPQIMLWKEAQKHTACSNCGRKIASFSRPLNYDDGGGYI